MTQSYATSQQSSHVCLFL